jgi:hypothetical protein
LHVIELGAQPGWFSSLVHYCHVCGFSIFFYLSFFCSSLCSFWATCLESAWLVFVFMISYLEMTPPYYLTLHLWVLNHWFLVLKFANLLQGSHHLQRNRQICSFLLILLMTFLWQCRYLLYLFFQNSFYWLAVPWYVIIC